MYFQIQTDSDIPASQQLYEQILFAIASRQFPPGYRLPSTRQLAMQTGLHRNTIGKVYGKLESTGMVDSMPGSGIYVRALGNESGKNEREETREPELIISDSLDLLLMRGVSLNEARNIFLTQIDLRIKCSGRTIVSVPKHDRGAGELMVMEIEDGLKISVQLVPIEILTRELKNMPYATIVTSRYFVGDIQKRLQRDNLVGKSRVIPIDLQDYTHEMEVVKKLPPNSYIGIVSVSQGILSVAERITLSLRNDVLVNTCIASDGYKLDAIVRRARTIMSDRASLKAVKRAIELASEDLGRIPQVVESSSYVGKKSLARLQRELGIEI
jgi:GntR family transcriptional regulator